MITLQSPKVDLDRIRTLRAVSIMLIGFGAGTLSGLLGLGGGVILVPAMVFLLGMSQHRAHGTSLATISPIVLISAIYYAKHGHVDWPVAIELAVGGVIGAIVGAKLASLSSARRLRRYFGIFLLLVALKMLYDAAAGYLGVHAGANGLAVGYAGSGVLMVLVGIATGALSGLLGVGGGIVMIPAMVLLLGIAQKTAQGISLAVIIPTALCGALMHARLGNVRLGTAWWLAIGGIGGGLAGSSIALGLPPAVLRGCFSLLVLFTGTQMIRRRPPRAQAATSPEDTGHSSP